MYPSTVNLLSSSLFAHHYEDAPRLEHLERSYHRARAVGRHYGMTIDDILNSSPKFWRVHMDNIIVRDTTAHMLVTIQYNLVAGTVAPFAVHRRDLRGLMDEILNFDISCPFMLSELGHGCDARNIETTATWQPDGSFRLNTPTRAATKFMPPSMPVAGIRRVAIVFARLLVNGEDRGLRPFIVPINDGKQMVKGVKSWLFPEITGGRPLDHGLTSFEDVYLPPSALLGDLAKPTNMRDQFLSAIHRLTTGALCVSLWTIPFLKCASFIVGKYSQNRTVQQGIHGERAPILSFRTQQLPVLHAVAQVAVMEPFALWVTEQYNDLSLHPAAKHGLAVIVKAVFLQNSQGSLSDLIERSGAQGMYPHNQMGAFESLARVTSIAEGEVLVVSIRLATELLLGRYNLPAAQRPDCLLAKHETGFVAELVDRLKDSTGHRGDQYNRYVLPQCRPMVLAIGQRMAYEAALDAGVDGDLLDLYEAGAVKSDPAWYVEKLGISREAQFEMECRAADAVLARLDEHLDSFNIEPYCTAPMLSSDRWEEIVNAAPMFTGNAEYDVLTAIESKL
ncbi:acyl-CoA oxidase [Aspergillus floccosus]